MNRIGIGFITALLAWSLLVCAKDLAVNEASPWTHMDFPTDADKFSFVIVTDRTGGHVPGVFRRATREVNLLAPDFVLCVGDLIDGYTEDESVIEEQWNEFISIVSTLNMPFFYVPGNHDLSNEVMRRAYQEHFGREHYSFDYKGYHFIILNSEDPPGSGGRIGEEQLAWLQQDLTESAKAKHTFLFLHRPLWSKKGTAAGNWPRVEELLSAHRYTVFAGHVHQYTKYRRYDRKYFTLGTTGGGTGLREPLGQLHHYVLVTMEDEEPHIALVKVGSILDENAVLAEDLALLTALYEGGYIIPPKFITQNETMSGSHEVSLRVKNTSHHSLVLQALWTYDTGMYHITPETFQAELAPDESSLLRATVTFLHQQATDSIEPPILNGVWKFTNSAGIPIEVPLELSLQGSRLLECEQLAFTPSIDADLTEWGDMPIRLEEGKKLFFQPAHWKGVQDCSAQIVVGYDSENLYVAAKVRDEALVTSDTDAVWEGDSLEMYFDLRIPSERTIATRDGMLQIVVAPGLRGEDQRLWAQSALSSMNLPQEMLIVSQVDEVGYGVEVKLPFTSIQALFDQVQTLSGKPDETFQFSFAVNDLDQDELGRVQMAWTGTQDNYRRTDGYVDFVLKK